MKPHMNTVTRNNIIAACAAAMVTKMPRCTDGDAVVDEPNEAFVIVVDSINPVDTGNSVSGTWCNRENIAA